MLKLVEAIINVAGLAGLLLGFSLPMAVLVIGLVVSALNKDLQVRGRVTRGTIAFLVLVIGAWLTLVAVFCPPAPDPVDTPRIQRESSLMRDAGKDEMRSD